MDLDRYGIAWNGPEEPVGQLMPIGYWTPWHVAQAEIERLRAENEALRELARAWRRHASCEDLDLDYELQQRTSRLAPRSTDVALAAQQEG